MTAPQRQHGAPIRFRLVLPHTRVGFGVFSIDPVEQLIGAPLEHILEPLMTAAKSLRRSPNGVTQAVFPLALPEGEGASIPLGAWGEAGFANERGLLRLTVPIQASGWLAGRLGPALVRGPEQGMSVEGVPVASYWLRMQPGMRGSFPLGGLGEVCVEAG